MITWPRCAALVHRERDVAEEAEREHLEARLAQALVARVQRRRRAAIGSARRIDLGLRRGVAGDVDLLDQEQRAELGRPARARARRRLGAAGSTAVGGAAAARRAGSRRRRGLRGGRRGCAAVGDCAAARRPARDRSTSDSPASSVNVAHCSRPVLPFATCAGPRSSFVHRARGVQRPARLSRARGRARASAMRRSLRVGVPATPRDPDDRRHRRARPARPARDRRPAARDAAFDVAAGRRGRRARQP